MIGLAGSVAEAVRGVRIVDAVPSRLGKQDVNLEMDVVYSRLFGALRPTVIGMIDDLRRARRPDQFVSLTNALLREFLRHQKTQEQTRQRLDSQERRRAALIRQTPKPISEIRAASDDISLDKFFDHCLGCALHALRCVGDGIAWKALDYDRRAIAVLGDGRRVGRLAPDLGLCVELEEMDRLWSLEHRYCIHNDLTNCLRHADLTIPARLNGQPAVEIAEVKRSGHYRKTQRARLDERLEFIRTGGRPSTDSQPARRILPPQVRLRTYLKELRLAVARARVDGLADFAPHPCMTVAVADYDKLLHETLERDEAWPDQACHRLGWDPRDPRVIQSLSFVRRLREQRNSFAFLAPYGIFPLDPEDAADVILGRLDICSTVNCDELERTLARAGLAVRVAGGGDAERLFLRASDGRHTVTLPPVIREQMLTELTTPQTLIEPVQTALEAVARDLSPQPADHLLPYAGEGDVWEAALDA